MKCQHSIEHLENEIHFHRMHALEARVIGRKLRERGPQPRLS